MKHSIGMIVLAAMITGCFGSAQVHAESNAENRLVALFSKLSQGPNLSHEQDDWQQLASHCNSGMGELGAEVMAEDNGRYAMRFVCNTAQRVQGQRVYGGDSFWATPWYSDKAFDGKFYLAGYVTAVVLFDGAVLGTAPKLDASHGAPYESSISLLEDYAPGVVSSQTIEAALRRWVNQSAQHGQILRQGGEALGGAKGTKPE